MKVILKINSFITNLSSEYRYSDYIIYLRVDHLKEYTYPGNAEIFDVQEVYTQTETTVLQA